MDMKEFCKNLQKVVNDFESNSEKDKSTCYGYNYQEKKPDYMSYLEKFCDQGYINLEKSSAGKQKRYRIKEVNGSAYDYLKKCQVE